MKLHSPDAQTILERDRARLLECPLCGARQISTVTHTLTGEVQCQCPQCGLAAPRASYAGGATSDARARQTWNDLIRILTGEDA